MEKEIANTETTSTEATAPPVEIVQSAAAADSPVEKATVDTEKYRKAFEVLWPDSQGVIHKDKLKEFFRTSLNSLYCEDMANCLIDMMKPDEDGHITMESLIHAFSLAYWTPESVAAMHEVLKSNPDIINQIADWKKILKTLGVEMTDVEVDAIIDQARARAADLLSAEMDKASDLIENKEEVMRKSSEILDTIRARISEMDITGQAQVQMEGGADSMDKTQEKDVEAEPPVSQQIVGEPQKETQ